MATTRRNLFKFTGGLAVAIPLAMLMRESSAAHNDALRSALKYQDTPMGAKQCSGCVHFVPGASPKSKGECKIMPGDNEISPTGACLGWAEKK